MDKSIIILIIIALSGCLQNPKRNRYLIPLNFHGTVYVYYKVNGAPPLVIEDGYRLVVVPDSGVVHTSTEIMPGKLHDEYLLYSASGRMKLPPQRIGGGAVDEREKNNGEREIISWFEVL